MNTSVFNPEVLFKAELVLRIVISILCGAIIGIERKNRGKGAGIRTHIIVAIASCLMMIISQYGYESFFNGFNNASVELKFDPSRIAAQIVSGIGFLGAGMIFVHKNTISGLTTAAGIWATAGIGMGLGCGMYFISIVTTAFIVVLQVVLHSKRFKFLATPTEHEMFFVVNGDYETADMIKTILAEYDIVTVRTGFEKSGEDLLQITFVVHYYGEIDRKAITKKLFEESCIKKAFI